MSVRTRALVLSSLVVAILGGAGLAASPAGAHPLGNFTVNRYSGLLLSPGRVEVRYMLDMAEIPTFQEGWTIDADADGTQSSLELRAWAGRTAEGIASNLTLKAGGVAVELTTRSSDVSFRRGQAGLPTLRLVTVLEGELPSSGALEYGDGNFPDRIGWKEITARSAPGVALSGSSVPASSLSEELSRYPTDLLSSPLDVSEASLSFRSDATAPGSGGSTGSGSSADSGPADGSRVSGSPAAGGSFANLVTWRLTPLVLVASLLLAFGFGALHALGPGHGKTITAAYLVGRGAGVREAATVGVAVAFMHTASVLALGLVLFLVTRSFPAEEVYPWLTLATGAIALGLGGGLVRARVRARRRGEDPWHGHTHPWDSAKESDPSGDALRTLGGLRGHEKGPASGAAAEASAGSSSDPEAADEVATAPGVVLLLDREESGGRRLPPGAGHHHDHASGNHHDHPHRHAGVEGSGRGPVSGKGMLALALAGGILPSPTAFVVLTGAVSANRAGYGLALVGAFSIGLAAALMAVGVLALRARSLISRRLDGRFAAWIPIASAAVIVGFGLFFTLRGIVQIA